MEDQNAIFIMPPGPQVIKTFFMLNSAEYELYPAHKC